MYLLFFEEFPTILEMQSLKTSIEVLWRLVLCFTWQCFDISLVLTPTHLNSRGKTLPSLKCVAKTSFERCQNIAKTLPSLKCVGVKTYLHSNGY